EPHLVAFVDFGGGYIQTRSVVVYVSGSHPDVNQMDEGDLRSGSGSLRGRSSL
ncbi:MAG: hypothetical protein RL119_994, partial [Actinomycetota bacterium]